MSSDIFLNFEKLSLNIIENELEFMTDDNLLHWFDECDVVNDSAFGNNLYHGSIVATFIVNLYETTLNTILGRILGFSEIEILKCSHNIKLQLICKMFNIDLSTIKSDNSYAVLQNVIKIRNDITHYKCNAVSVGHYIYENTEIAKGTCKEPLARIFTKEHMYKAYTETLKFLEILCQKCNLVLCKDCWVIDSDARDYACEFVITQDRYNEIETD